MFVLNCEIQLKIHLINVFQMHWISKLLFDENDSGIEDYDCTL